MGCLLRDCRREEVYFGHCGRDRDSSINWTKKSGTNKGHIYVTDHNIKSVTASLIGCLADETLADIQRG